MKMISFIFVLLVVCPLHPATSQECTATVSLASLRCGGTTSTSQPGPSVPQQGLPGKRGAPGVKGEKGEPNANEDLFNKMMNKLNLLEESLETQKAKVELLEEFKATAELLIANLTGKLAKITKMRSCQDISTTLKIRRNGTYKIQPNDEVDPFDVHCQFIGNKIITSVGHDSEGEIEVATKCSQPRCFSTTINYQATFGQMRSLVELIGDCRQYVKYRCMASALFGTIWGPFAGWMNWNGEMKSYWGESGGRDGYCACGVRGDCADPEWHCNCDKNDIVEREDSGFLTQAEDLPVRKLYFGDVDGASEFGFYTLGALECMG